MEAELLENTAEAISTGLLQLLTEWGVSGKWAKYVNLVIMLLCAIIVIAIAYFIAKIIIRWFLNKTAGPTRTPFLHFLASNKFPQSLSLLTFYAIAEAFLPIIFYGFRTWAKIFTKLLDVSLVFIIISIITAFISAVFNFVRSRPAYAHKPLSSYLQVIKIIAYLIGAVVIFSIVTGKSPTVFFAAMGAASAILMLMFRDTIMGFVASIQVTTNDMVRLDDWITIPKYGADGNVVEINLTTVKIQNFDKTITTVPTYALISDSFQNWRGMQDAGVRRIKRAINLQQSSIRFIEESEWETFKKIPDLASFINEYQNHTISCSDNAILREFIPNGEKITNGGLFRKYTEWYLQNHPYINHEAMAMVRQLAPTTKGLPIELYAFINTTETNQFESIAADIFDHLIASIPYFNLSIFEDPSGKDVMLLNNHS